jgi:sporulation protein YqfC
MCDFKKARKEISMGKITNINKKVRNALDIPREVAGKIPKITVTAFDEMLIENFKAILEYEDFFVRISTYIGIISINGFNLNLSQMTEDDILVTGKIESIDLEAAK